MKWFLHHSLIILILILAACSNETYEKIPENLPLIATVNIKDMTVSFINPDKQKILAEWKVEKPYSGGLILADQDTLLLYGKQVETVDMYSLSKGTLIGEWETGKGIVNGKLLSNKQEVVFADQFNHKIRFYNLKGKETTSVKMKQNPLTLLESPDEGQLYSISFSFKELAVIDLKQKEKIKSFPIHSSAAGAILRENEKEVWIGGHGEGAQIESNIHIYDLATGKLNRKIAAPMMPVNFLEKDRFIYALSHGSSTLYKITESGKVRDSIKIGANPFEIASLKNNLIVAGYDSNDIHMVNPATMKIIKTIKVGKGPFQIIVREGEKQ